MAGFIGVRAKKRRRNIIISLILIIIFFLFYYILPVFEFPETLPSETLLPSSQEAISPEVKLTIEDLEFKIIDREKKIIFRTNEIKKLNEKLKTLAKENKQLSDSVVDLINQQNSDSSVIGEVENLNKQLAKIKKDNTNEKNDLFKKIEKVISENELSKKKYDTIANKNIQLTILKDLLEKKIEEQIGAIDELNLSIQKLKDSYHHR